MEMVCFQAASENDKENQIPLLDIHLNAKAAVRDQLNNVVRERTGKLTLKKTLDNAVKTKSNENAMGAVKWTAKYIVNGQPVVTKAPKINRRSNEQKTALNNISNKSLAAASGKDDKTEDVRNEDGQLDAVRVSKRNYHCCCMVCTAKMHITNCCLL